MTEYLVGLRKGWAWIFAFVILGGCVGYGIALGTTKAYQGTAQVFMAEPRIQTLPATTPSLDDFVQARLQSLTSVVNAPAVTRRVIAELNLRMTDQQLANKISADAPDGKTLINIRVTDQVPRVAAQLTNVVSQKFIETARTLLEPTGSRQSDVRLVVVRPATVPTSAISPDRQVYAELGLLAGLVSGVLLLGLIAARRSRPNQAVVAR